jgi:hypothetical protein|nr:MAG TPA: ParM-like protein [Caudoviricetes sp.]
MSQKIGLEVANGFIKVVSNDTELTYPNKLKRLTGSEFNIVGGIGTIYEYEGKQYTLDTTGISSGGRSSDRYLSKEYLLELLIAITQVITERNVSLTIGVPCRDFEKIDLKKQIVKKLTGRHAINVIIDDVVEEYVINIQDVFVACEPLGTLCDFVFNEKLQIVNNRNKFNYVVIDIGYSTTDILATNGLQVEKLAGDDTGCMDIVNDLVREMNNKYKGTDYHFTHNDVSDDISPIIHKYGETFDFTEELDLVKTDFVSALETVIRRSGINLAHYDRIIYTGGGALAIKNHIKLRSNAIVYPEAQIANARGFYKYTLIKKG